MADNPFDQFDTAQPAANGNPFDQFEGTTAPAPQPQPQAQAAPDGAGFTDEQKQAIIAHLPLALKAPDPVADLEQFGQEVSGGKSKIGNAKDIIAHLKNGAEPQAFAFERPTIDPNMAPKANASPSVGEWLRNALGDALLSSIGPAGATAVASAKESAKPFIEHVANSTAMDYGPEIGGVIDSILHGGDISLNASHERAKLIGDSEGHPVASLTGELTGALLPAAVGNEAGIADAPRLVKGLVATGEGTAYGSGAAGPGNRAEGAVVGAGIGAATEAAAPFVAKFIAATKAGDTAAAAEVAKAAHDAGIDLPRFVVGGTKDARKAAALEQTAMGSGPIVAATNKMLDQSAAARTAIADSLGSSASTSAQLGDDALNAAVAQNRKLRAAGSALYKTAKDATGDATIPPTKTVAAIDDLLTEENGKIGGSKIAPILQKYRDDLTNAGQITIDQARNLRTDLREQLGADANATPDKTDRIVKTIMGGVNEDMTNGLTAAGKPSAVPLYKEADANWAQQRQLEDEVLKPFLGKNFDNWGEDVAKKIFSDAKGNGTRLARFLNTLPEDDANRVRATLVNRLGSSRDAAQNAAGDAFSLDTFLTNWNELKGSRNLVFPKETVQSLDKLAQVAEVAKSFGRKMNRSNTGGVVSYLMHGGPTAVGTGGAIFTHDPKMLAYGLLLSGMSAVKQYGAAKLLASPSFARKLAATPMSAKGAVAFWSRPWVKSLQIKNPAIAAEIQTFQKAFLAHANDNTLTSAAADPQQQDQQ